MDLYNYRARVIRVVDGDTVRLAIDLGFRMSWTSNCRLTGVNAPEMNEEAGRKAKAYLETLLPVGKEILIKSVSLDKYGRALFDASLEDKLMLSEEMMRSGHAKKY